ncbi:RagB/SusD family nutrient uptake outer membrane protein [Pedobacter soli]|uniref:Starch-binding associating with outer membrane n=1 Tax=Pedobacter soli TaxID=390242 RepID=A0A1G6Z8Z8_9SPHI|nr:RagB/SusD family nutrient uptake outer membrane protein [Pedobacter soli]SDD99118.1 Starch-binding associating with outer membrane [Pedobacter soli]
MKKYYIIFTFAILFIALQSCKKGLEENPKTFVSPSSFFTNADSYEQAVLGIYTNIRGAYTQNPMMMREMFSDICGAPGNAEQAQASYENNHQPFFYSVRAEWSNNYTIIKNANFILSYIPVATLINAEKKALLTAEARFLRAYAYFQLVQFYGDVPLRTTPLTDYSEAQSPRVGQADIYKFILEDLNFAEANLPENAPQQGRVYKMVATALLAKVYLTMAGYPLKQIQYFQNAKEKALLVINSGKFQLVSEYAKVFHNTAYTTESIWEQLFRVDVGGNAMQGLTSTAEGFVPILKPASSFMNSFPVGDQRRTWGIQDSYIGPKKNTLAPFFQKFVNTSFIDAGTTPSGIINNYSIPFIRLAEMYLIAAEAENELNGPAAAYDYINKIRARARINKTDPTNVPDLNGLTKEAFRKAIYMERKWELHLEGSTWFDLKRTQTIDVIQAMRGASLVHPIGTYNYNWYIPDSEILNNSIPQNAAYQ